MRLFIAILLNEDLRNIIIDIQKEMRQQGVLGNYTPDENLHLTLAFIGEYNDPDQVLDVISSIPMKPFEMSLNGVGAFDDLWWVGVEHSQALNSYERRLRHALAEAGIPFDRKRFIPHITVLRRANMVLKKLHVEPVKSIAMVVDHASLMRSDRGKNGMIYTEIV